MVQCDQSIIYNANNDKQQTNVTNQLKIDNAKRNQKILENIKTEITDPISLRTLEAISETGASSWLTALLIKENGLFLEKQALRDILNLRYNIQLKNLPSKCVRGKSFTIDHALQDADLSRYDITKYEILPQKYYQNATMTCILKRC